MSSDLTPKLPKALDLDLAAVRAKLAQEDGKRFWQSIEQLSETTEYRQFLENEFPHVPETDDQAGINRRDVLKFAAASAALAGLSACTKMPTQKIVPYVKPPEEIIPGRPLFYATAMTLAGVANGLLVESHMGRPTKIEGNREHPGSLGGTDVFAQAATLGLYAPDRSKTVMRDGRISDWASFQAAMGNAKTQLLQGGAGFRILTEVITSPSLAAQIQGLVKQFPGSQWHQYEPCGRDNVREGAKLAFGRPVNTVYKLDQADVIVSLDADFLTCGPGHVRYAREFSSRRGGAGRGGGKYRRGRRIWRERDSRRLDPGGGQGFGRTPRKFGGHRGRRATAGGTRFGACHECGAGQRGQDGLLHGAARSEPDQRNRIVARASQRHQRRQSADAADSGRQSSVRRARGFRFCSNTVESAAANSFRPVLRRNRRMGPVEW